MARKIGYAHALEFGGLGREEQLGLITAGGFSRLVVGGAAGRLIVRSLGSTVGVRVECAITSRNQSVNGRRDSLCYRDELAGA